MIQVGSAGLFVDLKYHQPLFSVIKYLPECTLFKRGEHIGGIQPNTDPSSSSETERTTFFSLPSLDDDVLRQAAPQSNRKNLLIENLEIDMDPTIQRFEDELCQLVNRDRLEKQKFTRDKNTSTALPESNSRVTIVERRLRVRLSLFHHLCQTSPSLIMNRLAFIMVTAMFKIP